METAQADELLGGARAPSANPAPAPGGAGWRYYPFLSYSQRRGRDASLARQAHDDSAPLKGFQTTCAETKRTPCSPMSPAQTPARPTGLATRPAVIYAKNVCLTADTAAGSGWNCPTSIGELNRCSPAPVTLRHQLEQVHTAMISYNGGVPLAQNGPGGRRRADGSTRAGVPGQ